MVDGTGGPARTADVAVTDGIVVDGRPRGRPGHRTIDADGRAGHARIRRHPHPLRRPGHLGRPPAAVVGQRRHHRGDGELRGRFRSGHGRRPRQADRADGRGRGPARDRAARGPVLGVGDHRRVPRRPRPAAPRHRLRRPGGPRPAPAVRHGPARRRPGAGHRRGDRRDGPAGRRGVEAGALGFTTSPDPQPSHQPGRAHADPDRGAGGTGRHRRGHRPRPARACCR